MDERNTGRYIDGEYITSSMMEAAFLTAKGFNYSVHCDENMITSFIFKNIGGIIKDLTDEFWLNSKEQKLLQTFCHVRKVAFQKKNNDRSNRISK